MVLEINEEIFLYTFAGEEDFSSAKANQIYGKTTYLFDLDTFTVCESGTDEARAAERTIVFPSLTRAQAQREYIKALDNKRLNHIFKNLDGKAYWDMFWKYFDDGADKFNAFNMFEDRLRIQKIVEWCDENNIPYYINKKDEVIRDIMEYEM